MKKLILILFLPLLMNGQTNVDRLAEQLTALVDVSFNNWKCTTNLSYRPEELSRPDFDDSQWLTVKLDQHLQLDSCYFRRVIEIPTNIAGVTIKGKLKFITTVDDYGYLWINGASRGKFLWDGEFILTENAEPGQKYVIVIKGINTGGPMRIIHATIAFPEQLPIQKRISDFALSMRVAQKLLSFDTYQSNSNVRIDPGIDKSAMDKQEKTNLGNLLQSLAAKVDVKALVNGDTAKFMTSLTEIRKEMKPVSEFAKRFTLHFASNAHIDAAWLWRKKETVEVCRRTFSSVMNMFKARPDFTYTQSAAAYYEWMQIYYPDLFEEIKESVKLKRWEISGGMWVEPDCNLPSGDSWEHQLLYAQNFFNDNFGVRAKIGWNPDSFGYNWNLPQFMLKAGLNAFITQKIGWNDTNVFPYRLFWWESPDGSKILTYFPFDYVNQITDPLGIIDWLRQYEANTGLTNMMVLFGVGDHGGGPSLEMMARIDKLRDLDIFPVVEFGTAESYLDWVRGHDLKDLPVWNNELYLEYHRGTATTQANTKKWNRGNEELLTTAEKFSSIASVKNGINYKDDLRDAWKKVLFNQFHDILPGSGIREIYLDADMDHREAERLGKYVLNGSLKDLSSRINTSRIKEGEPLIVFNPLSWERTDPVTIQIAGDDMDDYSIFDTNGNKIISQSIVKGRLDREIVFIAKSVPALGYKTYFLKKNGGISGARETDSYFATVASTGIAKFENTRFNITLDPENGWIKSIYDKGLNKELLSGYGNKLQLLEDKPAAYEAWNIGLTGREFPSKFRKIELVENGPVRKILRVTRDYLKPGTIKDFPTEDFPSSFFTQDLILYEGLDRIDFRTDVEWWEEQTMLKSAFQFAVDDSAATYEIPFGEIRRSTTLKAQWDKGKWEVNAQKWADLSNDEFGISLLNKAKYGYDTRGNIMRLSLLRSPKWPDPTADRGNHSIDYALYPHMGRVESAETVHRGYEFNYPLIAVRESIHDGTLPPENSFMKINNPDVIITSVKQSEKSTNIWIVTLYESKGKGSDLLLELPFRPLKAFDSNFLEEEGTRLQCSDSGINFTIGKNQTKVLKIYLK